MYLQMKDRERHETRDMYSLSTFQEGNMSTWGTVDGGLGCRPVRGPSSPPLH